MFEGLAYAIVDSLQGYPQGGELYLTGGGAASATGYKLLPTVAGARWSPAPLMNSALAGGDSGGP